MVFISNSPPITENSIKGEPYITVSAKGISNGLSDTYNDGADFGPDTMLGATSPDQVESPYSQTSGIQEAINYAVANGYDTIMLKNGIYYITAPFTTYSDYGIQTQIIIPPTPNGNPQHLRITSETPVQLGIPNGPMSTSGAIIYSKPPSYPTATTSPYPWVIYVAPAYDLEIDVLIRQVGTTQQVNGINLQGAYTYHGNIRCDIDAVMDSGSPSTPPTGLSTIPVATAIQTPSENYGEGFNFMNISVFGYYLGILLYSQTEIGTAYFSYVFAPLMVASTYHPKNIWYLNNNNCTHLFTLAFIGSEYVEIYCELADIQDNINTSSWFRMVDHIYFGNSPYSAPASGIVISGFIRGIRTSYGSIPYNAPLIIGGDLNGLQNYLRVETSYVQTPSTPSVPASGTAQQNTNPYDVKVYVNGGALTEIQVTINGTAYTVYSNSTASAVYEGFTIPVGASITLTYTTAPTWTWLPA